LENLKPKKFGFIGWNLKRDLLKIKMFRQALQLLLNRPEMLKKIQV